MIAALCVLIVILLIVLGTLVLFCRKVCQENSKMWDRVNHAERKMRDHQAEKLLLKQELQAWENAAVVVRKTKPNPPKSPETRVVTDTGVRRRKSNGRGGKSRGNSGRSRSSSDDSGVVTGAIIATSVYAGSSYDSSSSDCGSSSSSFGGSCD